MATDTFSNYKKLDFSILRFCDLVTFGLPHLFNFHSQINQTQQFKTKLEFRPHYAVLKLNRPAVVKTIKIDKYLRVTDNKNFRFFRIYGGLTDEAENMKLLLEGEFNSNELPTTLPLIHKTDNNDYFPVVYIKVQPLKTSLIQFSFDLLLLEFYGNDDPMYMGNLLRKNNWYNEEHIVKLCLKHFRQKGYNNTFKALQEETGIYLENEDVNRLYNYLVNDGDFCNVEELIKIWINNGIFDKAIEQQNYIHSWTIKETFSERKPEPRGGHQLVLDKENQMIYLYGGWNGYQELSDFWCFNLRTNKWSIKCHASELFGGPTPRSCHKMVFNSKTGIIYIFGRHLNDKIRSNQSDFYSYNVRTNNWKKICNNASEIGGPSTIYDHQMCIDSEKGIIYISGGRLASSPNSESVKSINFFSGFYSYNIQKNEWNKLLVKIDLDSEAIITSNINQQILIARAGHSMVFHEKRRKIYIYGGKRGKEDITGMLSYDVDENRFEFVNIKKSNIMKNYEEPILGTYTQKVTIDTDKDEIYFFFSLNRQADILALEKAQSSYNSVWMFSLKYNKWTEIYSLKHDSEKCTYADDSFLKPVVHKEPCPRYAHQIIYDDSTKIHYLFGGNPGKSIESLIRLNDFWTFTMKRPTRNDFLKNVQYSIKKLRYKEYLKIDSIKAVLYLQNYLSKSVDFKNASEVEEFQRQSFKLFNYEQNYNPKNVKNDFSCATKKSEDKNENKTNLSGSFSLLSFKSQPLSSPDSSSSSVSTKKFKIRKQKQEEVCFDKKIPLYDESFYNLHKNNSNNEETFEDFYFNIKCFRTQLFNRITELIYDNTVQPRNNLSDYVHLCRD